VTACAIAAAGGAEGVNAEPRVVPARAWITVTIALDSREYPMRRACRGACLTFARSGGEHIVRQ
jgi:hypothetical protein